MTSTFLRGLRYFAVAALALPSIAGAVVANQTDTFEDGTTQNWVVALLGSGHPAPPSNQLGGPGGGDDNFLKLTSLGGTGTGSRLVAINFNNQWAGNYNAIAGISMDVRNLGDTNLNLRLYLENPIAGPPTDDAISSDAVFLRAGGDWTTATFSFAPSALTVLNGDLNALLANVTAIRIVNSDSAQFPPFPGAGMLGVDNIRAIDEPSMLKLIAALGLVAFVIRRQRR